MADVIAIVADGIATLSDGRCYCHCGRWNSHTGWNAVKADLIAITSANQNYKNIIKINILQTPSKVGVLQSKTFSHTPDEAMSG